MKKLLLSLLTAFALQVPIDGFPADPDSAIVIDRLYQVVPLAGQDCSIYASVSRPSGPKPTPGASLLSQDRQIRAPGG